MRYSRLFAPTLREVAAEVEMASHRLLLRAGFIRPLAAGIYSFLPLGWRTLRKITDVIREEMDRVGGQELLLPALHPRELWTESGRAATMADILFTVKDRRGGAFFLGPTHEEVITDLVRRNVRSYRELPLLLYQFQMKYRDEPRPRGGLVRAREFLMKDAYSFARTEAELDATYQRMSEAYTRIFARMGLDATPVDAGAGAIGGTETKEFMLLNDTGEDAILLCPRCGAAANQEVADYRLVVAEPAEAPRTMARVDTPGAHTVQEVCDFLRTVPERLVKTLILLADGRPVAALVRGDRELNEERFRALLGARTLMMAAPEQIVAATGGPVGFSGPVGLSIPIYADEELRGLVNFVTGANAADTHLIDVNWTDVTSPITWARLRFAEAGDLCRHCEGPYEARRGMELGHIFKLRYAIAEPLHAAITDEDGSERLLMMGCYGIGVSRMLAAVAEACHDDNGLIWPPRIAPYHVYLMATNMLDAAQRELAERLYVELEDAGIEVLFDDRDERAGVKFTDADLLGLPLRVVVGKRAGADEVELRGRTEPAAAVVPAAGLPERLRARIAAG